MLPLKLLQTEPDAIERSCRNRAIDVNLDELVALNNSRCNLQEKFDSLRAEQNQASAAIARHKRDGSDAGAIFQRMKEIADTLKTVQTDLAAVRQQLNDRLLNIPNLLDDRVPIGSSERDNQTIRQWGEPRQFDFCPRDHVTIGESLGLLDFERGAKLSGARFTVYRGWGARMERALINFMLAVHTEEHNYLEIIPPYLVTAETMTGTGQLPKFEEDLFKTTDGLYLIPTAEVPLTNLFAGEVLSAKLLPQRLTAYTPCFRSEAGSYGRDTKGLIRQHQFNKVELVSLTRPEDSSQELERLTGNAEVILQRLGLPYRVVLLCSADVGFSATMTYDLEVWLPGQNTYREISSCSNCADFQANRANIRYKSAGEKARLVHTLNGSGLAVGRTLIAILENYQQADGSVSIPEALQPYMGGITKLTAAPNNEKI